VEGKFVTHLENIGLPAFERMKKCFLLACQSALLSRSAERRSGRVWQPALVESAATLSAEEESARHTLLPADVEDIQGSGASGELSISRMGTPDASPSSSEPLNKLAAGDAEVDKACFPPNRTSGEDASSYSTSGHEAIRLDAAPVQ
jgi:hypothetical protein